MTDGLSLAGRTALVTGASKGIGRAIALAMSEAGARVAVSARRLEMAEQVADQCGGRTLALALDVTDEEACLCAVRTAEKQLGQLDVLVNNAGVAESSKFCDMSTDMWRRILSVDLDGPFWLTRSALPGMLKRSRGAVISIGSVASRTGLAYASGYTVAKHGLLGMTRALAVEHADSGVTFNCVCPHYVDTPMTHGTIANIMARTGRSRQEACRPLLTPQGTLISPADIAAICVLLASEVGRSINGQAIQIDGGYLSA